MATPDTHYVPFDAPGKYLARAHCGKLVRPHRDHSINPTCPRCAAVQRAIEAIPASVFGETTDHSGGN